MTLTVNDNSGADNATGTAMVTATVVVSLDVNGVDNINAQDAQILYYLALPPGSNVDTLLGQLLGNAADVSELRARATAWLAENPANPDLDNSNSLDGDDWRILYYALRFEDELRASPALRDALGIDLDTLNKALGLR